MSPEAASGTWSFLTTRRVIPKGLFRVRHIHEDELSAPLPRYLSGEALSEVAVRIDHGEPPPCLHVLERERFDQAGFADAGFADQVHVKQPVRLLQPEALAWRACVGLCEV